MEIYDFSECEYSNRNGSYGGAAGDKDGILINGEPWIAKYPKSNEGMAKSDKLSRTTQTPLSEYIGSHIYGILGRAICPSLPYSLCLNITLQQPTIFFADTRFSYHSLSQLSNSLLYQT